jgi:hypothetical protein
MLMEVVEHIPRYECDVLLSGVRAVLERGGVLLLTVPHSNKPVERKYFLHFRIQSLSNHLAPSFNVIEAILFAQKSLVRRLLNVGLGNRFFLMASQSTLNFLFGFHDTYLFDCSNEKECQRIYVRAVEK